MLEKKLSVGYITNILLRDFITPIPIKEKIMTNGMIQDIKMVI